MKKNILFLTLAILTPYNNLKTNSIINLEQIKNICKDNKTSIICVSSIFLIYVCLSNKLSKIENLFDSKINMVTDKLKDLEKDMNQAYITGDRGSTGFEDLDFDDYDLWVWGLDKGLTNE